MSNTIAILAALASLVPAPREFAERPGLYEVSVQMKCPKYDWWDFDYKAACLEAANMTFAVDAAMPPEGYSLKVRQEGVEIAAADDAGRFYARMTLLQLAELVHTNVVRIPCCDIRDWPQYRWRGVMVDEARHFMGKTVVKRAIEMMARHKLNVLHWHLTDDQGWRLEIKRHPELVKYGSVRSCSMAYRTHARWLPPRKISEYELDNEKYGPYFYTHEDIREVLSFARDHHVVVVPEIEIPGHSLAFLAAYPELSCTGNVPREPCPHPTISDDVICAGNDAAISVLEDVFDEVCELFPDSPYIHIGGDECPHVRWRSCPKCQARLREKQLKDENGLQEWFCTHFVRYLERKGRKAIGWDDILTGDVPKSAMGMSWRSRTKADVARRGHQLVVVPGEFCYFDNPQFENGAGDPFSYHQPWIKPVTLSQVYEFNPVSGLPEEAKRLVVGGQATTWSESILNIYDFEWKLWPRACALAEVLWTAPAERDFGGFIKRMRVHRRRLLELGVNCAPLGVDAAE